LTDPILESSITDDFSYTTIGCSFGLSCGLRVGPAGGITYLAFIAGSPVEELRLSGGGGGGALAPTFNLTFSKTGFRAF
jgi:hypothetical protein